MMPSSPPLLITLQTYPRHPERSEGSGSFQLAPQLNTHKTSPPALVTSHPHLVTLSATKGLAVPLGPKHP
ncbi:MAG: hypothetical protein VB108_10420 [Anaerolineaceae bacterium]|nr:hypothetical protein [Anaerolineaceae bacterium]